MTLGRDGRPFSSALRRTRGTRWVRSGFAVKDRREAPGLTQEESTERAGIHRTYLSDVERGTRNLNLINIERVALALSVKISELFRSVEKG